MLSGFRQRGAIRVKIEISALAVLCRKSQTANRYPLGRSRPLRIALLSRLDVDLLDSWILGIIRASGYVFSASRFALQ